MAHTSIWTEKYRPLLDDIASENNDFVKSQGKSIHSLITKVFNNEVQNTDKISSQKNLTSHFLLHGRPGTGKTSFCRALAETIFSSFHSKIKHSSSYQKNIRHNSNYVLEINVSEFRDNGSLLFSKLITFCRSVANHFEREHDRKHRPLFEKFIMLDECDNMGPGMERTLCDLIDTYGSRICFCFMCNYINNIRDDLRSRLQLVQFLGLKPSFIQHKLEKICQTENLHFTSDHLKTTILNDIVRESEGDIRKAITFLQSIAVVSANMNVEEQLIEKKKKQQFKPTSINTSINTFFTISPPLRSILLPVLGESQNDFIINDIFTFIKEKDNHKHMGDSLAAFTLKLIKRNVSSRHLIEIFMRYIDSKNYDINCDLILALSKLEKKTKFVPNDQLLLLEYSLLLFSFF